MTNTRLSALDPTAEMLSSPPGAALPRLSRPNTDPASRTTGTQGRAQDLEAQQVAAAAPLQAPDGPTGDRAHEQGVRELDGGPTVVPHRGARALSKPVLKPLISSTTLVNAC